MTAVGSNDVTSVPSGAYNERSGHFVDKVERKRTERALSIAWISILCGALSGLAMGLWSFGGPIAVPEWIGEYDALPRRFLRLAHVAMFALGALHILMVTQLDKSTMRPDRKVIVLRAMAAGNILMPALLIAAAFWEPLKYLTTVPALSLSTAFAMIAVDAVRTVKGA